MNCSSTACGSQRWAALVGTLAAVPGLAGCSMAPPAPAVPVAAVPGSANPAEDADASAPLGAAKPAGPTAEAGTKITPPTTPSDAGNDEELRAGSGGPS